MDTADRVPAPEVTSPVHALHQDTSGTIQPDQSNPSHRNVRTTARVDPSDLSPSAALSATSSEGFNLNDTTSFQPLRSNNDHLAQPLQLPSVRLPESKRETRMNNDNEIDWIVPKEEKVSNVLILNLIRVSSFTFKGTGSRTHNRRTSATYPRHCYH